MSNGCYIVIPASSPTPSQWGAPPRPDLGTSYCPTPGQHPPPATRHPGPHQAFSSLPVHTTDSLPQWRRRQSNYDRTSFCWLCCRDTQFRCGRAAAPQSSNCTAQPGRNPISVQYCYCNPHPIAGLHVSGLSRKMNICWRVCCEGGAAGGGLFWLL